jgi:hypothetical protein
MLWVANHSAVVTSEKFKSVQMKRWFLIPPIGFAHKPETPESTIRLNCQEFDDHIIVRTNIIPSIQNTPFIDRE